MSDTDTTRRFPRSMKEAWREWHENAIGITEPIVTPHWPLWVKALRWIFNL